MTTPPPAQGDGVKGPSSTEPTGEAPMDQAQPNNNEGQMGVPRPRPVFSAVTRRLAEQAGHPTVGEQADALTRLADPFWGPGDADVFARFVLPNLRQMDRIAHVASIRKLTDQIARLEIGYGPFPEFCALRRGEAPDVHCDRQAVEAKVLLAAAVAHAIDADWEARCRPALARRTR